MNLSFKDIQFIIEAIDNLIATYQYRINQVEDLDDDEASDLGNDCMFLEALRKDLSTSIDQIVSSTRDSSSVTMESVSLSELMPLVLKLPISERLVLVDAITESIRQELSMIK